MDGARVELGKITTYKNLLHLPKITVSAESIGRQCDVIGRAANIFLTNENAPHDSQGK